jgi:hypothetical protein
MSVPNFDARTPSTISFGVPALDGDVAVDGV